MEPSEYLRRLHEDMQLPGRLWKGYLEAGNCFRTLTEFIPIKHDPDHYVDVLAFWENHVTGPRLLFIRVFENGPAFKLEPYTTNYTNPRSPWNN